jgi:NADH dehydrogenase [ubiquinone] 1 alpha subcomplex assembly factor 1
MTTIFSTILYLIMQTLSIVDFTKESSLQNWSVVDDTVMGGVSAGGMRVNAEGHGVFQGHVSLDNNGGFSSIRYNAGKTALGGYHKFVIKIKGDGKAYQLRVKTKSSQYYSYIANFTATNTWQIIEIPFSSMYPAFRGRQLNMPNFAGNQLEEIGFLIGNKKEEDFSLLIDYVYVQSIY